MIHMGHMSCFESYASWCNQCLLPYLTPLLQVANAFFTSPTYTVVKIDVFNIVKY